MTIKDFIKFGDIVKSYGIAHRLTKLKYARPKRFNAIPPHSFPLTLGHPVLRNISSPINFDSPEDMEHLSAFQAATQNFKEEASGIAAPQLGLNKRIIGLWQNTDFNEDGGPETSEKSVWKIYANPRIIGRMPEMGHSHEACLSIGRGLIGIVPRNQNIIIEAYDVDIQEMITREVSAPDSYIMQHEIDHLDGILFIDKVDTYQEKSSKYPMLFNPHYLENETFGSGPDSLLYKEKITINLINNINYYVLAFVLGVYASDIWETIREKMIYVVTGKNPEKQYRESNQ